MPDFRPPRTGENTRPAQANNFSNYPVSTPGCVLAGRYFLAIPNYRFLTPCGKKAEFKNQETERA
jgi:hypothetical protein